jgi:hypothetical protein
MQPLRDFAAAALIGALAPAASALTLQIDVTGTVSLVDAPLASQFTVGDAISATAFVDAPATDSNPDPALGEYGPLTLSASFGSYTVTATPISSAVLVANNSVDELRLGTAGLVGASVNGFAPSSLTFRFTDTTATAFASDALPTAPSLAAFDSDQITFSFVQSGQPVAFVFGDVTSLTTSLVPEPATATLLAAGLAALGLRAAPSLCRRGRNGSAHGR